jgi:hypothetical protein
MTKKDFELIVDSIQEGVDDAIEFLIKYQSKDGTQILTTEENLKRRLKKSLAHSFGDRLVYTSDGFDKTRFQSRVETVARKSD